MRERHRSAEFIELLQQIDAYYPEGRRIRIICDNHSAHTSKEIQAFLRTRPGRFEFVFTPVHASWLNRVENLFSKMANSVLRGIRAHSKEISPHDCWLTGAYSTKRLFHRTGSIRSTTYLP